jgi:voltage-dependent calcium channel T type alpha-1G
MSENLEKRLTKINAVFMIIFTIEAVFKLIAMGRLYFKDAWNNFDFVVVVMSIFVLGVSYIPNIGLDLSTQVTIGRVLRILRVVRLIKRAKNLQIIFETI